MDSFNQAQRSLLHYNEAIESVDMRAYVHGYNVRILTKCLLKRLNNKVYKFNFTEEEIENISKASALHDIGKSKIPKEILNSPNKLTPDEFNIIKSHPALGVRVINDISMHESKDSEVIEIAKEISYRHHERYDGGGYPEGLVGDDIPFYVQVVSIADAFDALTSTRSYRKALSTQRAIDIICDDGCGVFNPILINCLMDELRL